MQESPKSRSERLWNSVPVPPHVAERAHERFTMQPDGCWISTYSIGNHGYAQIGWQQDGERHMVLAHRASWVHERGQMPLGMTLDHTCKTRSCVNPAHLRLLPNFENARRTNGDDWPMGFCKNGHPASQLVPMTRKTKAGARRTGLTCGPCMREAQRAYRERKRAA